MCLGAGSSSTSAVYSRFFEHVSEIVYEGLFLCLLSFAEEVDAKKQLWCSLAAGLRCQLGQGSVC